MKIIDLLNKIANGEEVPKKIKYNNFIYEYWKEETVIDYRCYDETTRLYGFLSSRVDERTFSILNDEIEIIEEEKKIPEETTVSEEQILFNNLTSIDQDYVIRIMKMLQQPTNYLKSKGE